ncbi:MAG: lysozyme family protein [Acidiferrobacteraceae bacterium]
MTGELLGEANLELGADLKPLDADLIRAEARVAKSVAAMQAMLDSLQAHADIRVAAIEAALAKTGGNGGPVVIGSAPGANQTVREGSEVWGIRGPQHAGSLTNPIVTVLAASKFYPMGSYGAAIGADNTTDAQRGESGGYATAADMAALTAAVTDLANNAAPGAQLATAGSNGLGENGTGTRTVVALDRQNGDALLRAASAMEGIARSVERSSAAPGRRGTVVDVGGSRTTIYNTRSTGGPSAAELAAAASMLRRSSAGSATATGVPFAYSIGGTGGGGGGPTILLPAAAGFGGGGNNRRTDIYYHRSNEGGGGRGGGPSLLAQLGWGGGMLGMAGVGSALSFAGLGVEHLLFTALGLAGSAVGGAIGGGLLGLGSLGKLGVGAGSDLAVTRSAISNAKNAYTAYENLQTAVATYGKSSLQATQAQQQLNATLADMPPIVAKASLALAKQADALGTFWQKQTAQGQVTADRMLSQWMNTGKHFIPSVAQAAQSNLSIIQTDLQPLFAWLNGPDAMGIFNNLENLFRQDLPYAMGAFDNGVELVARIINIAANSTGGFIQHLDQLLTRWNSLSNAQIGVVISRYVNDFRLWDHFVVMLVKDIYGLFHQDVGTGNSIIAELTTMLDKLHAYETSARGSAQLQNIFMVHKTEILELLKLLPELGSVFGNVYMDIAPSAVAIMNNDVIPMLNDLAQALAWVAKNVPGASTVMGILLMARTFRGGGLLGGGLLGGLLGRGGGAAAKSGLLGKGEQLVTRDATGAVTGTIESGAAGGFAASALGKGLAMIPGMGGAWGASAIGDVVAAAASAALPYLLAAGAGFVIVDYLLQHHYRTVTASPGNVRGNMPAANAIVMPSLDARAFGPNGTVGFQPGDTLNIKKVGDFANYSAGELRALIREMQQAGSIKVNGISTVKDQEIALAKAALQTKDAFNAAFNASWEAVNRFFLNTSRTLPAIVDDLHTLIRRISTNQGLASTLGKQLAGTALGKFTTAIIDQMYLGKISAQKGLQAINDAVKNGIAQGYVTWQSGLGQELTALTTSYEYRRIGTQDYYAHLHSIVASGESQIRQTVQQSLTQQLDDLKAQRQKGIITQGQYNVQAKQLQDQANSTTAAQMAAWASTVAGAMQQSGTLTARGMQIIVAEVNKALGLFGGAKLPLPEAIAWANYQVNGMPGGNIGSGVGHRATGGMLVDRPMFIAGEEAPAHPEIVLATNPAYRSRNVGLWVLAGHELGIPGFAHGGIAAPRVGGGELGVLVGDALSKVAGAAGSYVGSRQPRIGHGSASIGHLVPGIMAIEAQAAAIAGLPFDATIVAELLSKESAGGVNEPPSGSLNATGPNQVIPGTFAEYALPGYTNINNPLDNAIASMRYIKSRYGSLAGMAAATGLFGSGYVGYRRGGIVGRLGGRMRNMLARRHGAHHGGRHVGHGGGSIHGGTIWGPPGAGTDTNLPWATASGIALAVGYLTNVGNALSSTLQSEQTAAGNLNTITTGLGALQPGTSLSSLGLTGTALSALGMSGGAAMAAIGGGAGMYAAEAQQATAQIGQYKSLQAQLVSAYQAALKTHNKTLQNTLLGELQQVDSAIVTTAGQLQAALFGEIQATAQTYADKATALGNTTTTLQGIEGLNPGDTLAALGLSPAILQTLGLGPNSQSLVGTGLSYYQNLAQTQGGRLTPAQIAAATAGINALSSSLTSQETPVERELAYYQSQLPGLTGQNRTTVLDSMQGLAQKLIGLQNSIDTNTAGLTALTQATNANTSATTNATGAMTGTVSYSFQSQQYLASLSSERPVNLGVGS